MATDPPVPSIALLRHGEMVDALCDGLAASVGEPPRRFDTHLSSVIVAGGFAWKLKKPVDLGFVDFRTPDSRRAACDDELRLNRRLAASLYLGVVPVLGPLARARFGAAGETPPQGAPVLDHAVLMRAFPQRALWTLRVPADEVDAAEATALGATIGAFHRDRAAVRAGSPHGTAVAVLARIDENFDALRAQGATYAPDLLDALERDAHARHARLAAAIDARDRDGFVRDCHGDLHLGNVVTVEGAAIPFDCLEFSESLRTVDVASEVAFATMDLGHHGREDLAHALLDGWLAETGDFDAVPLLDAFAAYRAMVRAKVAAIRAAQLAPAAPDRAAQARDEAAAYLRTAAAAGRRDAPVLVAMHGLSGSGKSVLSAALVCAIRGVRLRSDLERKRALGLAPADRSGAHGAMYAAAARDAVYDRLAGLAAPLLRDGRTVVVDASFLARAQRTRFRDLAHACGAGFAIVEASAPEAVLRERLAARAARGGDPSDADAAVLDVQLRDRDPLDDAERAVTLVRRVGDPIDAASLRTAWRALRDARRG